MVNMLLALANDIMAVYADAVLVAHKDRAQDVKTQLLYLRLRVLFRLKFFQKTIGLGVGLKLWYWALLSR